MCEGRKGGRCACNVCASTCMCMHVRQSHAGRRKRTLWVGGVIEIQTAITKDCSSCGSEIYCAWSSIIHKGTQKIWSDFNKAF